MRIMNSEPTLREMLEEMRGYSIDRFLPETPWNEPDAPLISWRMEHD